MLAVSDATLVKQATPPHLGLSIYVIYMHTYIGMYTYICKCIFRCSLDCSGVPNVMAQTPSRSDSRLWADFILWYIFENWCWMRCCHETSGKNSGMCTTRRVMRYSWEDSGLVLLVCTVMTCAINTGCLAFYIAPETNRKTGWFALLWNI